MHERIFHDAAGRLIGHVLIERHADALYDAALGLHAGKARVDRRAAVHDRRVIQHIHLTGLPVQLDLDHADHERRGRDGRRVRSRGFHRCYIAAHGLGRDVKQRDLARAVYPAHRAARELQPVRLAVQQVCRNRADIFFQLAARLFDRLAGDIRRGGRIRARVIGRGVRVRAEYRNVVHRAVQALGGHLGEDGVAARAHIRRADDQVVEALVAQLDGRGAHVHARNA